VIDNRASAGGNLAMDAVAKAAPDDTTLGFTLGFDNTGNITINPYRRMAAPMVSRYNPRPRRRA